MNNYNIKERVLIINAQAVQTLIIARFLKKSGYIVDIICDGKDNYGYHTKYATKRYIGPECKDEKNHLPFLIKILKQEEYATIIPTDDDAALILSKYKNDIIKYTNILIPDYDTFCKAYDKNKLMNLCREKGYPHPRTIDLSESNLTTIPTNIFPALIKPNYTSGGRGMTLVNSIEELKEKAPRIIKEYGESHLQEFIEPGGKQIKVQIFIDRRTNIFYSSVIHKQRYYPEKGGSSCCNITIEEENLTLICKKILDDIGWNGFADFDLIEDPKDNVCKIMEINPRIPACIKSAILSGVDYGTMIADVATGKELKTYKYKPGQKLRHIGFEMLWFKYSKNRFKTSPSWFRWIDRNLSFQDFSWRDPLPFFYGTWGNIKKQMNPEFRKSKDGLR